jgi:hypothetical protein
MGRPVGLDRPPSNGETQGVQEAGTTRKRIIFGVDITMEGRRQMTGTGTVTKNLQGTRRNRRKRQRGDRETTNRRETGEGRRRRANAGKCIKRPTSRVDRHFGKIDPSLVTQGWTDNKPCLVTVDTGAYVTVARPDFGFCSKYYK